MKHARLDLARSAELLPLLSGTIAVFGQIEAERLRGLEDLEIQAISDSFVTHKSLARLNITALRELRTKTENAIVFLPRAKALAFDLIARAIEAAPDGWVLVDGQKTDGIDSIAKQIAKKVSVEGSYSKGHGKTIWFHGSNAQGLKELRAEQARKVDGFVTAPGVFSADGIDPASKMLIEHLPTELAGTIADLGAGWGYLSSEILRRSPNVKAIHLIEDNALALDCAAKNVTDERAEFHWADAINWRSTSALDAVIMNPPFHTSRAAQPELGLAFISSAAKLLKPNSQLFMVANAHLPYEPALEQNFAQYEIHLETLHVILD